MTLIRTIETDYEKLDLTNDFMFGKVMQDERNCIDMLERLTGNQIDSVTTVVNQKMLQVTSDSKGIRYDIYVEDQRDRVYDTEMQNISSSSDAVTLSKRARAYQSMIDLNLLEVGGDYAKLKQSYVIFICTFDPFGLGYSCYAFENICKEPSDLKLFDERTILFFNTKGRYINVTKEAEGFLNYLETREVSDDYTGRLDAAVSYARHNKEWRVEYMKTYFHDLDVKKEGIAIGLKQGLAEGISQGELTVLIKMVQKKLSRGMALADIADDLEESVESVKHIVEAIVACGDGATVDEVYKILQGGMKDV